MLRAYFDTTVYSELEKSRPGEVPALRAALRSDAVSASLSLADIEELLGQVKTDRQATIKKLALARDLVGFHGMLKQPADILMESIEAYSQNANTPTVTLPEHQRQVVVRSLVDIVAGSSRLDETLSEILVDIDAAKERWVKTMRTAQSMALEDLRLRGLEAARGELTFDTFWKNPSIDLAEGFAERAGCVEACRQRGLDGLLHVPAVRLGIGVVLSQAYAQLVGMPGQPDRRLPDRGTVTTSGTRSSAQPRTYS